MALLNGVHLPQLYCLHRKLTAITEGFGEIFQSRQENGKG